MTTYVPYVHTYDPTDPTDPTVGQTTLIPQTTPYTPKPQSWSEKLMSQQINTADLNQPAPAIGGSLTQITSPIANLAQMQIGNDLGLGPAINLGYGLTGTSPGTGAFANPTLAKAMPGTPGKVQTSNTPAWLAWIQAKAGDYGIVFFGAALALGALLISQKDTAIKIAGAIK